MPIFKFTAKDESGKTRSGKVEAATQKAALDILKEQKLVVVSFAEEAGELSVEKLLQKIRGVPFGEVVTFTRQLSTMMQAGLPLIQSLEILAAQTGNQAMREVLSEVLKDVGGGMPLSQSLSKHPDVFPRVYVSLLRAGEASGTLDQILIRLADTLEKQREFRSKTKGALVYPAIVTLAMGGVFVIMVVFVVPKLGVMYESMGAELPLPTRILIAISQLFTRRWWVLLSLIAAAVVGWRSFQASKTGKYFLARLTFRLPIFGKLSKQTELAEFTRTLGLLTGSGIPIVESLEIVAEALRNPLYHDAILASAEKVRRGTPLSEPLRADPNFPPLVSQMVSVGEETGKLDDVLGKLAAFFEAEAEQTVKNLSTAMEPLIMVLLGAMVGALVLSIILPIYKLTAQF